MFDLPVATTENRRRYAQFRKHLLRLGFTMLQFSVYARCNHSEEKAAAIGQRVAGALPPEGQVRILQLTDRQFGRMQIFWGKKQAPPEEPPSQLELF